MPCVQQYMSNWKEAQWYFGDAFSHNALLALLIIFYGFWFCFSTHFGFVSVMCVSAHTRVSCTFSSFNVFFCFYSGLFFLYLLFFWREKLKHRVRWVQRYRGSGRRGETLYNQNKLYENIFNLRTKEIKDMLSGCILNMYVCTLMLTLSSTLASSLQFTQRLITLTIFQWVVFCLGRLEISNAFWFVFLS